MANVKKQGTVSFTIKQPDPVGVYFDEENNAFLCLNEILRAAGMAGTNSSHWVNRLRKQTANYMRVLRRAPLPGQASAWFIRADSLDLLAAAQPNTSLYARRALIELAKAWKHAKKDFPQPKKPDERDSAPLLHLNAEPSSSSPSAPPLVVNGWSETCITV